MVRAYDPATLPPRQTGPMERAAEGYVQAVTNAARKLQQRRLLLEADVQRYIGAAQASSVLR